jgi:radical SAM superfamily enzyme YgiQ (UPF0313 family)
LHIASRLDPVRFDVQLYHEDWHGPFDPTRAAGFDIVFLTGLQPEFDRMRQLSYVFRRTGALVVGGGTICSLFPEFALRFFDVVCAGGIDAVVDVANDFLAGRTRALYRSDYLTARDVRLDHGLLTRAGIRSSVHFVESSRGCGFKCSFCVIPAEGGGHISYAVRTVREAIEDAVATSPRFSLRRLYPRVVFLDTNFSDNRAHVDAMLAMLAAHPHVRGWSAMITQNVLGDHALISSMAASKCKQLFVGLESLDPEALRRFNKKQNLGRRSVLDDVAHAERLGISIGYGYLFDPRYQTAAAMAREVRTIVDAPALPMPLFVSLMSPLIGTATFWEDAAQNRLAPNLRLRDLDGETIAYRPLADTPEALAGFIDRMFRRPWEVTGRLCVLIKTLARVRRARSWNPMQWWLIGAANLHSFFWARAYPSRRRTYMAGEHVLDPQYFDRPADLSSADRALYFDPIAVTDADGKLMPWLLPYRPATARSTADGLTESPLTVQEMG